jgi:hypothetical protein
MLEEVSVFVDLCVSAGLGVGRLTLDWRGVGTYPVGSAVVGAIPADYAGTIGMSIFQVRGVSSIVCASSRLDDLPST